MRFPELLRLPGESRDLPLRGRDGPARNPGLCRDGGDREGGFTLVELMVVIVIIGLLTTIVVINVLPSQEKARVEKAKADIALIEQGLEMYRLDNLNYPGTGEGLQSLVAPPAAAAQNGRYRAGGYLKKLPADPWGNPYQYANPGQHGTFDVYSFGADGRAGGEGDNADLGNWK